MTKSLTMFLVMTCALLAQARLMNAEGDVNVLKSRVADPSEAVKEATALLKQFLKHEEAREYERCYDLFSSRYKDTLKKESGIRNRDEYRNMRVFQGLRWRNSNIKDTRVYEGGARVLFIVEITFAQHIFGERIVTERIDSTFQLVKEGRMWAIDAWTYS